MPPRHMSTFLY